MMWRPRCASRASRATRSSATSTPSAGANASRMIARLREHGRRFFASGWNVFDLAVIVSALAPALGVDVALLRVARLARLAHLGRHIMSLRTRVLADAVR